jgi:hypothetical protein
MTDQQWHRWRSTRIVASMWWCGDDDCDCTKPVIERITPNHVAGYPWIHRETLWEGTFRTDSGLYPEERQQQYAELRDACHQYGIPIPKEAIMHLAGPMAPLP